MRPPTPDSIREDADRMLDARVLDPHEDLVHYSSMSEQDIEQVTRVLVGMRRWREAEQRVSLRSRASMKLNETDMRALRFLAVAKNEGRLVTAKMLADHLGISSASMTKLLDRLESAGHIERAAHPHDRRALVITITGPTHEDVRDTVGRTHARRFRVAAALTREEREIVIRFLDDLADTADDDPPFAARP